MTSVFARVLSVGCAIGAASVGGVYGAFSVMVMPALRHRPATEATATMQAINRAAPGALFVSVLVGTGLGCVVLGVLALIDLRAPASPWALGGAALYVLSLLITIGYHIPRNDALARVDATSIDAVERWSRYLAEWAPANHVRAVASVAGSVALMVSLVRPT